MKITKLVSCQNDLFLFSGQKLPFFWRRTKSYSGLNQHGRTGQLMMAEPLLPSAERLLKPVRRSAVRGIGFADPRATAKPLVRGAARGQNARMKNSGIEPKAALSVWIPVQSASPVPGQQIMHLPMEFSAALKVCN